MNGFESLRAPRAEGGWLAAPVCETGSFGTPEVGPCSADAKPRGARDRAAAPEAAGCSFKSCRGHACDLSGHRNDPGAPGGVTGQRVQVSSFLGVEPQRGGQGVQDGAARVDLLALFQPDAVVDADARDGGEFFAPRKSAGRGLAADATRRERPDVLLASWSLRMGDCSAWIASQVYARSIAGTS
jgi:hypothetical protein